MIKYDWLLIFFFMAEWFKSYEKKKNTETERILSICWLMSVVYIYRLGHENLLWYNHQSRIIMDSEHVISMSEV